VLINLLRVLRICVTLLQAAEIARSTELEETGVRIVDCRSVLPWAWTATV